VILLQADDISLSFGDRRILDSVSLRIPEGGRIALSGANGSGKSTLLKILAGQQESEGGGVSLQKAVRVSYLPQSGIEHRSRTLRDEMETAFDHFREDEARLEELGRELENRSSDDRRTRALLEEHHLISERIIGSHYYQRDQYISEVMAGLGFAPEDENRSCAEFSGGWQMRIALAKLLLERPDVMLLDEPTNYLDLDARTWLAGQLQRFPGGVLMVSHDRGFTDQIVNEVAELFLGKMKIWKGNYSRYEKLRAQEMDLLLKQWEQQQQEIRQLEDFISRFRANASKASQVQSRVKQLEKIIPIEIPEGLKRMKIRFPEAPRSGDMVLSAGGLEKSYGELHIFRDLDLEMARGERTVVLGPNGAGKSTLLRVLADRDRDYRGEVRLGSKVSPAYFAQESEDELDLSHTVLEEIEASAPTGLIPELRNMLGAFLFRGDDIHKPVSVLSGGEKNRLALVKMLLKPSNLLILDEPTNHLDLSSKEILLDALKQYAGTIIFVSHDEFFIRELATRVIELQIPSDRSDWRPVISIPGDYDYFRRWKETRSAGSPESVSSPSPVKAKDSAGTRDREDEGAAAEHQRMKQRRSEIQKLRKEEQHLMDEIEALEEELASIQAEMAKPEVYSDGAAIIDLQKRLEQKESKRDQLQERWVEVDLILGELETER
jgi:ATP-binding cassette subfamily F protein 3